MAYDAAKAHEYYENYTKKGKLKGRKKGSKKKSEKVQRLVGLSTAGLNDAGKMQFALMKEKLQTEMNAAMKKAKTQAEKDAIRMEYQNKALGEISKIKNDPSLAKQKATKSTSSKNSSGSSSKSTSSGKSSGSKGSSKSSSSSRSSGSKKSSSTSSSSKQTQQLEDIKTEIGNLSAAIKTMSDEQKEMVKEVVSQIMEKLLGVKGLDPSSVMKSLEGLKEDSKKTEDK